MIHVGIDHHKRYSQVCAIDNNGEVLFQEKINNSKDAFINLKNQLGNNEEISSVVEASRTWIVYDLLEELNFNPKVANPLKTKAIAEAQIKTDSIDALTLAKLLKADIIPEVHVADKEIRRIKNILRQRLYLVKLQTGVKNRIHHILDRNHITVEKEFTDIFGVRGKRWIETICKELSGSEGILLKENTDLLDVIASQIKKIENLLKEELKTTKEVEICKSLPGVGEVFGPLIALEIWDINRFSTEIKLVGYAGLASTTHSTGGKTYHGKLMQHCNKFLKLAFCEAAWSSIRSSFYFRSYFNRIKERIGSNKAIVGVARKLCEITWHCLKEKRPYEERVYKRRDWKIGKIRSQEKVLKVCQSR